MQPFLTNWRYLAMLNYAVDPRVLAPFVPPGTEIDFENGETFVSVFGLLFLDTRLLGLPVPLHRDFEEVTCVSTSAKNRPIRGAAALCSSVKWFRAMPLHWSRAPVTAKTILP